MTKSITITIAATLAAAVTAAGCGGGSSSESATEDRPGNPAVYQRIEATTDCMKLQEMFDTAEANHDINTDNQAQQEWETAYMGAAHERMQEVGCYS